MTIFERPIIRPNNPCFSSGPCAKHPGWSIQTLVNGAFGRSHRSKIGKDKLIEIINKSRTVLGIPNDYLIGIVPASDTGAVEMALWSLLGERGIDILAWESFGEGWVIDITKQLKLSDTRVFKADYGKLPDLSQVKFDRDVIFTWNGTTSGVRVPNGDWISDDRKGLVIVDATSAVFSMNIPWSKTDVVTWSWQKVLGGEGAHGMLVLSKRAVDRLERYKPAWPLPKIFRMTKYGKLIDGIFKGDTINTPSMLAVEDQIDALRWSENIGGIKVLISRSEANLAVLSAWVFKSSWATFLVEDVNIRSCTSICLTIKSPFFTKLSTDNQTVVTKKIASLLENEGVAYDIASYRDAPPGLRIWGGATVESSDIEKLTAWLDWSFTQVEAEWAIKV
ncbi:MAG: phosphoserine transaminase [Rhodospirillaceae bacterium]|jgi:phosphoserine aminotransferase|nr:phosphoserine transaminase [Rhodospirillaceae bacterium]